MLPASGGSVAVVGLGAGWLLLALAPFLPILRHWPPPGEVCHQSRLLT